MGRNLRKPQKYTTIQKSLIVLPFSHIASLFRQVLMKDSIAFSFEGAPLAAINDYKESFGVILKWGEKSINQSFSILFIISVFLVSLVLFFANFKRKRKFI
ncbi:MAG: hypothetical protein L0I79_06160 [Atopostipes sp.]|nr:hypothetical protein [Atopostipes sp.]